MASFLDWLNKGSKQLESVGNVIIDKQMNVNTYTLVDDRVFTVAEDALVSFNGGYYESIKRGSEEHKAIKEINKQQFSS